MSKILIVDDRPVNREVLSTILGYRNHRVLQASDGAEALDIVRAERPDLIISDILMPTMDGFEFVRQLRMDPAVAGTKVMFYTAHYLKREAEGLANACGVTQVVTKPAEPQAIYDAVDTALGIAVQVVKISEPAQDFDREHLSAVTNKLAAQADLLRATNGRLAALIELSQEMGQEKDMSRLLENFCAGARKIMGAKYALIAMVDGTGKLTRFSTSGLDAKTICQLGPPDPASAMAANLLKVKSIWNVKDADAHKSAGLPVNFPAAQTFLGATISSLSTIYGWVCFADKVGVERFTPEDEKLASILSSQLGRIYENGVLYSELQRNVADLRASEARKTAMLDASLDGIITVDAHGKLLEFNPAAERKFGYSEAEIIGKDLADLIVPPGSGDTQGLDRYLKSNTGSILDKRVELMAMRADGSEFPAELALTRVKLEGPAMYIGFVRNIAERKQAEKQLRASEGRFRQIAENIREIFFLVDTQMTLVFYVSPAYEELWGQSCRSLYEDAKSWYDSVHPDDLERVQKVCMPNGTLVQYDIEHRVMRPDKSLRWIRARSFPIRNDAGQVYRFAGIVDDITEPKRLEEQLRQSQKMESIGLLAGGIAHDFNNLLTVINGRSELLMLQPGIDGKMRAQLELIYKTGERAAALTRQLLAFSRQQVLQPKILNLNSIVSDMEEMLKRLIRADISLQTALNPTLPPVLADPGQIEQVLLNLIVNASDAMPSGGRLTIETKQVELGEDYCRTRTDLNPGNYVMLAVSDTGTGMPPEVQAKIFEPFYTTKGIGKGTGLGLSTVFGIVKQSNGHIEVYSELGKGTAFKIFLPHAPNVSITAKSGTALRAVMSGTETILLVEDELGVRELVQDVLEMNGYQVLSAPQGVSALQICSDHTGPLQLLVTDVVMPEMSGPELADRLRKIRPALKVLFTSGYPDRAIVHNGTLNADVNFLQKPFTPANLSRKVREILDAP